MLIMEGLLRTRLLAILLTLSLGLVTQATAEPLSSPHDALVSELVVLKTTTWAPRGLTDSTKACEIAKDRVLGPNSQTFVWWNARTPRASRPT